MLIINSTPYQYIHEYLDWKPGQLLSLSTKVDWHSKWQYNFTQCITKVSQLTGWNWIEKWNHWNSVKIKQGACPTHFWHAWSAIASLFNHACMSQGHTNNKLRTRFLLLPTIYLAQTGMILVGMILARGHWDSLLTSNVAYLMSMSKVYEIS